MIDNQDEDQIRSPEPAEDRPSVRMSFTADLSGRDTLELLGISPWPVV